MSGGNCTYSSLSIPWPTPSSLLLYRFLGPDTIAHDYDQIMIRLNFIKIENKDYSTSFMKSPVKCTFLCCPQILSHAQLLFCSKF